MTKRTIPEPAKAIEVVDEVDVLVIGGGPAGVCAAVSAARIGAKTMLIERDGFLGGMWTSGLVLTLGGYNSWLRPYHRCVGGVPGEWLARAAALNGAEDSDGWVLNSDPETMKLVADALLQEASVKCLLHSWAARPILDGQVIVGAFIENVEGQVAVLAKVTVDCTGDGHMLAGSGAPWTKGPVLQPMTLCFRVGGVVTDADFDISAPVRIPVGPEPANWEGSLLRNYKSRRRDIKGDENEMLEASIRGELPPYGGPCFGGMERDIVWVNATRVYGDASLASDLTAAEIRGRRDVRTLLNYFRKCFPGFEGARLLCTAARIGVRESRRAVGQYTLSGEDIIQGTDFADSIAVGCWPIDVHPADGDVGIDHLSLPIPRPYQIPYRSLLPQGVDSLLVAGRCISATREALGSTRVGATCGATGQAAGLAAALAAKEGVSPSEVNWSALRSALVSQGAIVDPP